MKNIFKYKTRMGDETVHLPEKI